MLNKIHFFLPILTLILSGCASQYTVQNNQYTVQNKSNLNQPTKTIYPDSGVVTGRLSLFNSGKITPIKDQILYLAEVILDNEGKSSFASFDRINSPRAITDADGRFIFENIKPGKYGLVIDVITASYLLNKPGTSDPILIEVIEGNVVDLGDLTFEELPISK